MSSNDKPKQGFASFSEEKHKKASSRGGSAKVPKGFASLDPVARSIASSNAAKARWAKRKAERLEQEGK